MNERGAAAALESLSAGSEEQLDGLCSWLAEQDGVAGRYLARDLAAAVRTIAKTDASSAIMLESLLETLRGRPDSVLVARFSGTAARETYRLDGAAVGPTGTLAEEFAFVPLGAWPAHPERLAVVITHPSQGRLGAIRTAAWLQTVLGAISLAAYSISSDLTSVAAGPPMESAVFIDGQAGSGEALDTAARFSPNALEDLAIVFENEAVFNLLSDATARVPVDLAQGRLTLAARWLQVASSAVSTPDALVALGIALETITGDDTSGAVVERVTKRSATFLAARASRDDRVDVYQDELKRAKRLYGLRSRAAHGQYDEWTSDQAEGDRSRSELHRFVLEVCLGFRQHARERNMADVEDLKRWWSRVEIEGIFA